MEPPRPHSQPRSHSEAPPDESETDYNPELEEDREENDLRLKSRFEEIFEKYGKDFSGIGDEIDLETGDIVVDNGHLERMQHEADPGNSESSQFVRAFAENLEHEDEDEEQELEEDGTSDASGEETEDEGFTTDSGPAISGTRTIGEESTSQQPGLRDVGRTRRESTTSASEQSTNSREASEETSVEPAPAFNLAAMAGLSESMLALQSQAGQSQGDAIQALGLSIAKQLAVLMGATTKEKITKPKPKRKPGAWDFPELPQDKRPRLKSPPRRPRPAPAPSRPEISRRPEPESSIWAPSDHPRRTKRRKLKEVVDALVEENHGTDGFMAEDTTAEVQAPKEKSCANCETNVTPHWRHGPEGQDWCQSCAQYFYRYDLERPNTPSQVSDDSEGPEDEEAEERYYNPRYRPWTTNEDALIIELKEIHELGWKEIETYFEERTHWGLQGHYCKLLSKKPSEGRSVLIERGYICHDNKMEPRKGGFSSTEDEVLVYLRQNKRLEWAQIAERIPDQTAETVEARFQLIQSIHSKATQPESAPDVGTENGSDELLKTIEVPSLMKNSMDEDNFVIELREKYNFTWAQIASKFPLRTQSALQNRYIRELPKRKWLYEDEHGKGSWEMRDLGSAASQFITLSLKSGPEPVDGRIPQGNNHDHMDLVSWEAAGATRSNGSYGEFRLSMPTRNPDGPETSQAVKRHLSRLEGQGISQGSIAREMEPAEPGYTKAEDALLLQLHLDEGLSWDEIESRMPGRTVKSLRARWFRALRNKAQGKVSKMETPFLRQVLDTRVEETLAKGPAPAMNLFHSLLSSVKKPSAGEPEESDDELGIDLCAPENLQSAPAAVPKPRIHMASILDSPTITRSKEPAPADPPVQKPLEVVMETGIQPVEENPVKRKRGRPRKEDSQRALKEAQSGLALVATTGADGELEQPVKRKRGRPLGSKTKNKRPNPDPNAPKKKAPKEAAGGQENKKPDSPQQLPNVEKEKPRTIIKSVEKSSGSGPSTMTSLAKAKRTNEDHQAISATKPNTVNKTNRDLNRAMPVPKSPLKASHETTQHDIDDDEFVAISEFETPDRRNSSERRSQEPIDSPITTPVNVYITPARYNQNSQPYYIAPPVPDPSPLLHESSRRLQSSTADHAIDPNLFAATEVQTAKAPMSQSSKKSLPVNKKKPLASTQEPSTAPVPRPAVDTAANKGRKDTSLSSPSRKSDRQDTAAAKPRLSGNDAPVPWAELITLAIESRPDRQMSAKDIVHYIDEQFPFYRSFGAEWKNTICSVLFKSSQFQRLGTGFEAIWALTDSSVPTPKQLSVDVEDVNGSNFKQIAPTKTANGGATASSPPSASWPNTIPDSQESVGTVSPPVNDQYWMKRAPVKRPKVAGQDRLGSTETIDLTNSDAEDEDHSMPTVKTPPQTLSYSEIKRYEPNSDSDVIIVDDDDTVDDNDDTEEDPTVSLGEESDEEAVRNPSFRRHAHFSSDVNRDPESTPAKTISTAPTSITTNNDSPADSRLPPMKHFKHTMSSPFPKTRKISPLNTYGKTKTPKTAPRLMQARPGAALLKSKKSTPITTPSTSQVRPKGSQNPVRRVLGPAFTPISRSTSVVNIPGSTRRVVQMLDGTPGDDTSEDELA